MPRWRSALICASLRPTSRSTASVSCPSAGDNTEKKPGFSEMVARAKWDAWNKLKGTSQEAAMQQYVDLIADLS